MAKGGGSANKTFLYQKTKSLLTKENLTAFVKEKIKDLGTAACPPYHLALVIGGTSAEANLAMVKKASAGYYDNLPTQGNEGGQAFRDLEWEKIVQKISWPAQSNELFYRWAPLQNMITSIKFCINIIWLLPTVFRDKKQSRIQKTLFSLKARRKDPSPFMMYPFFPFTR